MTEITQAMDVLDQAGLMPYLYATMVIMLAGVIVALIVSAVRKD